MPAIEDLANIILAKYDTDNGYSNRFNYPLEVLSIDDMPVYVFFEIKKKYKQIKLYIHSKNIIDNNGVHPLEHVIYYEQKLFELETDSEYSKKSVDYTTEEIVQAITQLREILPTLKFNLVIGKFVNNDIANKEILLLQEVLTFDNVKLVYEECSVCHETTKTRTNCNHPLCYRCWEKLPIMDEDNNVVGAYGKQMCPICRAIINEHAQFVVESDDDSAASYEEESDTDD